MCGLSLEVLKRRYLISTKDDVVVAYQATVRILNQDFLWDEDIASVNIGGFICGQSILQTYLKISGKS